MKIEILIKSRKDATLTIDGREMHVKRQFRETRLEGIKAPETENTLGGMAARHIYDQVSDIMLAFGQAEKLGGLGTWDKLSDDEAEELYDLMG
jgi:hypothetical protein